MLRDHRRWCCAFVAAAALALMAWPAGDSSAQGLFDFLFGGPRQPEAPQAPAPGPAQPSSRAPGASTTPSVSGTGRSQAYCVRLCDGRFFPVQQGSTGPERLCGMLCPASQTKIFLGSEIDHAVARDGTRYSTLTNAFLFRKREVPNCTCNGRDAFGLAPIDVASDPTLRRGDVVSPPDPHAPPAPAPTASPPAASPPAAKR
jgi:hypothetical protein